MAFYRNFLSSEKEIPDWKTLNECTISALRYVEIIRESLVFLHYVLYWHLIEIDIETSSLNLSSTLSCIRGTGSETTYLSPTCKFELIFFIIFIISFAIFYSGVLGPYHRLYLLILWQTY